MIILFILYYLLQESEYLRQLVSGAWAEGQRSRIEIKYDCSPDNFESILRFALGHRRKAKVYDQHLPGHQHLTNHHHADDPVDAATDADAAGTDAVDAQVIFAQPAGRTDWAALAGTTSRRPSSSPLSRMV